MKSTFICLLTLLYLGIVCQAWDSDLSNSANNQFGSFHPSFANNEIRRNNNSSDNTSHLGRSLKKNKGVPKEIIQQLSNLPQLMGNKKGSLTISGKHKKPTDIKKVEFVPVSKNMLKKKSFPLLSSKSKKQPMLHKNFFNKGKLNQPMMSPQLNLEEAKRISPITRYKPSPGLKTAKGFQKQKASPWPTKKAKQNKSSMNQHLNKSPKIKGAKKSGALKGKIPTKSPLLSKHKQDKDIFGNKKHSDSLSGSKQSKFQPFKQTSGKGNSLSKKKPEPWKHHKGKGVSSSKKQKKMASF